MKCLCQYYKKNSLKISNLLLLKEPLIVGISKALDKFTFSKALGLLIFKQAPSLHNIFFFKMLLKCTLTTPPPSHKVYHQSTDPVPLYSVYRKLQNVNKVFLDSRPIYQQTSNPETLCLHSLACCSHCTEELDQQNREIPYALACYKKNTFTNI